MNPTTEIYTRPWWLPGRHAQTIWGKVARRCRDLPITKRALPTLDGDEIELNSLPHVHSRPHVLLLHGLEGSLRSHYVNGILSASVDARLNAHVMMFRSCGTRPNRTRRLYHSGETQDVRTIVASLVAEYPSAQFFLAGVSLGGNVLLKYLGETPETIPANVIAAAAVSVPYDLSRSATSINQGFSRVYQRFFLQTLRAKAAEKAARFSGLPSPEQISRVRTMVDFDDLITAPLHGFSGAEDYYARSSAIHFLKHIKIPTLLLSAYDDPFLPHEVLADVASQAEANRALHIEFHRHGGHAGFVTGRFPWTAQYYMERRIVEFFERFLKSSVSSGGLAK